MHVVLAPAKKRFTFTPLHEELSFFLTTGSIMQQQPYKREQHEFDAKGYNIPTAGSQGWHYGIGDNFMSSNVLSGSTLGLNQPSTRWSTLSCGGQISGMPDSVCRQEPGSVASSIVPPTMGEYLMQETKRDNVIGTSNAGTSYSYSEPHFRDSMPADARPKLIYPELHGVPHYRTTSPLILPEEPVYVNAKQYHGILRRRQLRAKAELENKATRARKPYLHESRHLHALRRARGCGGRFVNTKKPNTSAANATRGEGNGIGHAPPTGYAPAVSAGLVEPSTGRTEFKGLSVQDTTGLEFFKWTRHRSFLSE